MAAPGGNEEILAGVANILQQASAALSCLGAAAQSAPAPGPEPGLGGAAAALAQVAAAFGGGGGALGNIAALAAAAGAHGVAPAPEVPEGGPIVIDENAEPEMTSLEFCQMHGLEAWVGDALDLLIPAQRAAVMNPLLNVGRVRNINAMVMSRIKHAVPLDQRLGMFVQINGLSEGVVDRISTLTPEQAEALLDSGFKIQKAERPSAVAMKRITDAIKSTRQALPLAGLPASTGLGSYPPTRGRELELFSPHTAADRSRTPFGRAGAIAGIAGDDMPPDVREFMNQLGLEWWCGEVLKRLSLFQRQQIIKEMANLASVRNPSGVIMSRVRGVVDIKELMSIFVDLNQFDRGVQDALEQLTEEQKVAVISPGIYLQNVRNPSIAVRSRINNVLAGKEAVGRRSTP